PANGVVNLEQDGSFTYTPDGDYHGTDTFTYTITAGSQTSSPATVTIDVRDINDPPTALFSFPSGTLTTGTGVQFTDESTDKDGTISSYSWSFGDGSAVSTDNNPTHTFSTAGTYTVTLTVTDDDGATA